ncbi:putative Ubiquitin carboxyl-terminal hydrolase 32 isoform X1 protein [Naja naja]|nr:putative Ubiquitin carboxyl-terminal hydrolase 32 isoform X1 protein [Naja naja]
MKWFQNRVLAYTGCFSRTQTIKEIHEYLSQRLRMKEEDMRLWLYNSENYLTLLDDEDHTLEYLNIQDEQHLIIEVRNKDMSWPEEMSFIANSSKIDRHKEKGATGLSNLGNTCFMNSSIQCVSNTQPLTQYFISGRHLYELNRTNPIGMKGHMAKCYGDLIQELWSGTQKNIAPLKLRWTIAKYAPRFNGFQQQDSQELLAFLLDGLHEDLNRVHDKPYVELKDSDGRPDWEVAAEAWENHLRRNRSIVVDLFHGQLRSQVKCKTCGHISVRFDPFNFLSLPLPMDSYMHIEIIVTKLDGTTPVRYGLRLNMDEKYSDLKKHLKLSTRQPKSPAFNDCFFVRLRSTDSRLSHFGFFKSLANRFLPWTVDQRGDQLPDEWGPPAVNLDPKRNAKHSGALQGGEWRDDEWSCDLTFRQPLHRLHHCSPQENVHTRKKDLYDAVWIQVSRLASPLPPQEATMTAWDISTLSLFGWFRKMATPVPGAPGTAEEHRSVEQSQRAQAEPINLDSCLRAFTSEEELGEDEMYYCSKCRTHCVATKKLDLWRLPPILIIHLKRFQFVNGRWIKSQKIVKFPRESFDPSAFLMPRDPSCWPPKLLTPQADDPAEPLILPEELHPDEIDTDSAYILFYEQQGVDYAQFLPKIEGKNMADTSSMDEDFESDYKKYCVLQ